MTLLDDGSYRPLTIFTRDVFPLVDADATDFIKIEQWSNPITYFVGPNGSCKSRTIRAISQKQPMEGVRILSADRLVGLMQFAHYNWGAKVLPNFRGLPLGDQEKGQALRETTSSGQANSELYSLRDEPEVWLRVVAFLRRALGRYVDLRETSGYLDPYVRIGDSEFSLLRDEGHGLKELTVLLAAIYRKDWKLLVVDEPELHLHPSMARLWLSELRATCVNLNRRAIVVTHEPSLIRPKSKGDLDSIWHFPVGAAPLNSKTRPVNLGACVSPMQEGRVTASLQENPRLVSQLVFSPRPVLVEGVHDVTALSVALNRISPPEVVAQTDFVECGGSGGVALWYEIASKIGLDFRAVADLDACFAPEVKRAMDASDKVTLGYKNELGAEPAITAQVIKQLIAAMDKAGVAKDPKSRAKWLAVDVPEESGNYILKSKLLEIWKDAGLWLHPQGTLEDVLGVKDKGVTQARVAAQSPGPIDAVARWSSFAMDTLGDVKLLLSVAVERIAHAIMEELREMPTRQFERPVGPTSAVDEKLVRVEPLGNGVHRIVVTAPAEYSGYWLEFSRDTPAANLILNPPSQ
ncbi:ATP-dependent nuclease [Streptomyces sp. NPDC091972]|uniref:ATP-dependent nuclease n=1 Tax=Streptomyces sp. NPDC091972 TaxID=3366007 RepID=UPI003813555A